MGENELQEGQLREVFSQFCISGEMVSISLLKKGHIHETYVSCWNSEAGQKRYVHQQLNSYVFPDLAAVMHNIDQVTSHIRSRISSSADQRTLELIPAHDGRLYYIDGSDGSWWRTFPFIENTVGYEACPDRNVAYESGRVCGQFASHVADLDVKNIRVTIPHFIDTPYRYEQFEQACRLDTEMRVKYCLNEVAYAREQAERGALLMDALNHGKIPTRVSHNDTKIDNILFSAETGKGVCIVDLDTCMPGSPLFDYGDLMRTTAILAREDEEDLSQIYVVKEFHEAVEEGFLSACSEILTTSEHELLPEMPSLVALTLGLRFLTDYINGDKYFKIHHPQHNLARARAQFQVSRELLAR